MGGALVDGIAGYLSLAILILLIVAGGHIMLVAALTGFGRTYEAADGSEVKEPPAETAR